MDKNVFCATFAVKNMNPNIALYEKTCLNCGQPFTANRLDQKYCSGDCRIQFNNHATRAKRHGHEAVTAPINFILWKNREALARFEDRERVKLDDLLRAGFQPGFITHFALDDKSGENQLFCYDRGYTFVDESTIKLLK